MSKGREPHWAEFPARRFKTPTWHPGEVRQERCRTDYIKRLIKILNRVDPSGEQLTVEELAATSDPKRALAEDGVGNRENMQKVGVVGGCIAGESRILEEAEDQKFLRRLAEWASSMTTASSASTSSRRKRSRRSRRS